MSGFLPLDYEPVPDFAEMVDTALRNQQEEIAQKRIRTGGRKRTFLEHTAHIPEGRGPLDFKQFTFLELLYSEEVAHADEAVFEKATQIGLSTMSNRLAIYHADEWQRVMIYTFPVEKELSHFSKQRIKPMIRKSPYLQERMLGGTDTIELKQFGPDGFVYFRGLQVPLDSIDADGLLIDEHDDSDQVNVEKSLSRISGPKSAGMLRRFGVPLVPDNGIADFYEKSDQRVWIVKCPACTKDNAIRGLASFQANVDIEREMMVCAKCRRPIDVRLGQWVAQYPGRSTIGFSISKMLLAAPTATGRLNLHRLIESSKKTKSFEIEAFRQRGLGEAYVAADARLSLEQVKACVVDGLHPLESLSSHNVVTMGIDVASSRALNVTIEEWIDDLHGRKVFVGTVEDDPVAGTAFQQICRLKARYGVTMAVIDQHPEGRFSQAFADVFPGEVYMASFFSPAPGGRKEPEPWNVDDIARKVSLWRTRVYDATFERFRLRHVMLPMLDELHEDYAKHLGNLLRKRKELENGTVRVDYVRIGPEDFGQCEAYNLAARELVTRARSFGVTTSAPQSLSQAYDDFTDVDRGGEFDMPEYRPGMS